MDERTELKEAIIESFPGLSDDPSFSISSKEDIHYNCIAWAYQLFKDRWMQYNARPTLDGIWYWWPDRATVSPDISAYVEAFEQENFSLCDNGDLDSKFVKIALYIKPETGNCSHASRQCRDGKWMSKLGKGNDIIHGTPFSLEGEQYGKVHCYMKKPR